MIIKKKLEVKIKNQIMLCPALGNEMYRNNNPFTKSWFEVMLIN